MHKLYSEDFLILDAALNPIIEIQGYDDEKINIINSQLGFWGDNEKVCEGKVYGIIGQYKEEQLTTELIENMREALEDDELLDESPVSE